MAAYGAWTSVMRGDCRWLPMPRILLRWNEGTDKRGCQEWSCPIYRAHVTGSNAPGAELRSQSATKKLGES